MAQYVVARVRSAAVSWAGDAPPEISERFEGRAYTLRELEQRGVRVVGGRAVYTANGQDWRLDLQPVGP